MKVAFFSTKSYDREYMNRANLNFGHELTYFDTALHASTAILAKDQQTICIFSGWQGNDGSPAQGEYPAYCFALCRL